MKVLPRHQAIWNLMEAAIRYGEARATAKCEILLVEHGVPLTKRDSDNTVCLLKKAQAALIKSRERAFEYRYTYSQLRWYFTRSPVVRAETMQLRASICRDREFNQGS